MAESLLGPSIAFGWRAGPEGDCNKNKVAELLVAHRKASQLLNSIMVDVQPERDKLRNPENSPQVLDPRWLHQGVLPGGSEVVSVSCHSVPPPIQIPPGKV